MGRKRVFCFVGWLVEWLVGLIAQVIKTSTSTLFFFVLSELADGQILGCFLFVSLIKQKPTPDPPVTLDYGAGLCLLSGHPIT
jgi:hypothetical protein